MLEQKLLYITKALPDPKSAEAGYKMSFNMLEHLVTRHVVTLISFTNGPEDVALAAQYPVKLHRVVTIPSTFAHKMLNIARRPLKPVLTSLRYDPRFRTQLGKELGECRPDVVFVDFTQMAGYISDIRAAAPNAFTVLYEHDVSAQMAARRAVYETGLPGLFWRREAQLLRHDEASLAKQYDLVCTPTQKDADLLVQLGVDPTRVSRISAFTLQQGEDGSWVDPGNADAPQLLFFGALARVENALAVRRLVTQLLPRLACEFPGVRLKVVGGGHQRLQEEFTADHRVEFTGYVPSILAEAQACQLAVFPLTLGAGVKIKVLEAARWGMPVVTTSVGAEGTGAESGVHLEIAETDEALVERILALLREPELRQRLGRAAHELCMAEFDFHSEMTRLDRLIETHRCTKNPTQA